MEMADGFHTDQPFLMARRATRKRKKICLARQTLTRSQVLGNVGVGGGVRGHEDPV